MHRVAAIMLALVVGCCPLLVNQGLLPAAAQEATPRAACPATTDEENIAIARAWHDEVINRRNPEILQDILAPEVVHHAAGGYPEILNEGA